MASGSFTSLPAKLHSSELPRFIKSSNEPLSLIYTFCSSSQEFKTANVRSLSSSIGWCVSKSSTIVPGVIQNFAAKQGW